MSSTVDQDAAALRSFADRASTLVDKLREKLFTAEDKLAAVDAATSSADKKVMQASCVTADLRLQAAEADLHKAAANYNTYLSERTSATIQLGGTAAAVGRAQPAAATARVSKGILKRKLPEPEEGYKDKEG